jgi:hypothetical protein
MICGEGQSPCALQWILRRLAAFEKHSTRTGQVASLTLKLTLAQFVNTVRYHVKLDRDIEHQGVSRPRY